MTRYTFREFAAGAYKAKVMAEARDIIAKAIEDTFEATPVAPGIIQKRLRGQTNPQRDFGTIVYDTRALSNSLVSKINGAAVAEGESGYFMATRSFKVGDSLTFSWGGPDAPYARLIHNGGGPGGHRGTFWIDAMTHRFPHYLKEAARAAK